MPRFDPGRGHMSSMGRYDLMKMISIKTHFLLHVLRRVRVLDLVATKNTSRILKTLHKSFTLGAMSKSTGRPPALSNASLVSLVNEFYNFKHIDVNSVRSFPSYDDRNYYFCELPLLTSDCDLKDLDGSCQGCEFVCKIFNSLHTPHDVVAGISKVWTYLESKGFKFSSQVVNKDGNVVTRFSPSTFGRSSDGADTSNDLTFSMRVMRFIPGELFDKVDKKYLTPKLLYETGVFLGRADAALKDVFHNVAIDQRDNLEWDLAHLLRLREHLSSIDDPKKRATIDGILNDFEEIVLPKIPSFSKGVLHGDPNGLNIILKKKENDEFEIAGLIDFDDTVNACYVFDIAMLLAYIMLENLEPIGHSSPVEFVGPMLRGYVSTFPLSSDEISSLYYLVLGRCCQSVIMGLLSYKAEPWNDYLLTTPRKAYQLMEVLLDMSKETVDKIWADALKQTEYTPA